MNTMKDITGRGNFALGHGIEKIQMLNNRTLTEVSTLTYCENEDYVFVSSILKDIVTGIEIIRIRFFESMFEKFAPNEIVLPLGKTGQYDNGKINELIEVAIESSTIALEMKKIDAEERRREFTERWSISACNNDTSEITIDSTIWEDITYDDSEVYVSPAIRAINDDFDSGYATINTRMSRYLYDEYAERRRRDEEARISEIYRNNMGIWRGR